MRAKSRLAMTLIEVVGGLALLGTLLVAVLLAKAKFTRQAATADRKLQAVAAADELLTVWRQDPNALPRDGSGSVAGDRQLSWRTRTVRLLHWARRRSGWRCSTTAPPAQCWQPSKSSSNRSHPPAAGMPRV
jgi:type II secretory pathway pseudopilin PulG